MLLIVTVIQEEHCCRHQDSALFSLWRFSEHYSLQVADLPAVYHVSLSRVIPIRYPDIQSLVATLKECLAKTARSVNCGFISLAP